MIIEIFIGVFIKDNFIRPFGGDFLVIFLLYFLLKSFISIHPLLLITGVLLLAYFIEMLQYFHIAELLQIKNKILRIIIGTSFSWGDIIAYTTGALGCFLSEKHILNKKS